jgi:hypothetical protein
VVEARELEGLADFLRPPRIATLLPAAERGPVAIVNTSRWRCDAFLVTRDGVTTFPLPSLTLREATQRADRYLSVLSAAEAAEIQYIQAQTVAPGETPRDTARRQLIAGRVAEHAHERVDTMLRGLNEWMWDTFAGGILDELGFAATPRGEAIWPRMWWCPTGPLSVLPLHTAGYHHHDREDETAELRTVIDRVVSSYTPTLRALLEARRPDARPAHEHHDFDRLLFVNVPNLPGQVPIHNAAEQSALFDAFPDNRRTVLDRDEATPEAVSAALPKYRWVHFSCHGDQDLNDPVRGGLQLRDGTLTVEMIASGQFHGDFAGLSACKTAVGGLALLDEAITLGSALHYTGYRHVVAALWSVDNKASAEVFGYLYRTIATDGRLIPDQAPRALHEVIRRMRDRRPDWPHLWTPFTHIGP